MEVLLFSDRIYKHSTHIRMPISTIKSFINKKKKRGQSASSSTSSGTSGSFQLEDEHDQEYALFSSNSENSSVGTIGSEHNLSGALPSSFIHPSPNHDRTNAQRNQTSHNPLTHTIGLEQHSSDSNEGAENNRNYGDTSILNRRNSFESSANTLLVDDTSSTANTLLPSADNDGTSVYTRAPEYNNSRMRSTAELGGGSRNIMNLRGMLRRNQVDSDWYDDEHCKTLPIYSTRFKSGAHVFESDLAAKVTRTLLKRKPSTMNIGFSSTSSTTTNNTTTTSSSPFSSASSFPNSKGKGKGKRETGLRFVNFGGSSSRSASTSNSSSNDNDNSSNSSSNFNYINTGSSSNNSSGINNNSSSSINISRNYPIPEEEQLEREQNTQNDTINNSTLETCTHNDIPMPPSIFGQPHTSYNPFSKSRTLFMTIFKYGGTQGQQTLLNDVVMEHNIELGLVPRPVDNYSSVFNNNSNSGIHSMNNNSSSHSSASSSSTKSHNHEKIPLCKVFQEVIRGSLDKVKYIIEFENSLDFAQPTVTMINDGSKRVTDTMYNNVRMRWYGTTGLASTFGSGFFELRFVDKLTSINIPDATLQNNSSIGASGNTTTSNNGNQEYENILANDLMETSLMDRNNSEESLRIGNGIGSSSSSSSHNNNNNTGDNSESDRERLLQLQKIQLDAQRRRPPVALYHNISIKTLASTRKVGEFTIWQPGYELADIIVIMGLVLREQEQRKDVEYQHVISSRFFTAI